MPILAPISQQLGIDLLHFGVVAGLSLMIRLLRPPIDMVLFVLTGVAKLFVERTTIAILRGWYLCSFPLAILTYIPSFILWLPKALPQFNHSFASTRTTMC